MKATIRKVHRWLRLLAGVQIIAWMASGHYFSLYPIEEIRGEHLTRGPERLEDGPRWTNGIPWQVSEQPSIGTWILPGYSRS